MLSVLTSPILVLTVVP